MAAPCVKASDCIDLDVDPVDGNLYATPIIQGDPAPAAWPFPADPTDCNGLHCGPTGLWVAPDHTTRAFSANSGTAQPGVAGVVADILGVAIDLDAFEAAYGGATKQVTTDATISYTNETCRTVNFWVAWATGQLAYQIYNGWAVALGTLNTVTSPNLTTAQAPNQQVNLADSPLNPGTYLGLIYPPAWYRAQSFLLPGQSITVACHGLCQVLAAGGGGPNSARFFTGVNAYLEIFTR